MIQVIKGLGKMRTEKYTKDLRKQLFADLVRADSGSTIDRVNILES